MRSLTHSLPPVTWLYTLSTANVDFGRQSTSRCVLWRIRLPPVTWLYGRSTANVDFGRQSTSRCVLWRIRLPPVTWLYRRSTAYVDFGRQSTSRCVLWRIRLSPVTWLYRRSTAYVDFGRQSTSRCVLWRIRLSPVTWLYRRSSAAACCQRLVGCASYTGSDWGKLSGNCRRLVYGATSLACDIVVVTGVVSLQVQPCKVSALSSEVLRLSIHKGDSTVLPS